MAVLYSEFCGELEDIRETFKFLTILRIYPSLLQGPWDRMTRSLGIQETLKGSQGLALPAIGSQKKC